MSRFDDVAIRGTLVPEAHTRVVRAVMDNALLVLGYLDPATVIATDARRPSTMDILRAALKVDTIDDFSKKRITETLEIFPTIVGAIQRLPKGTRSALEGINRTIDKAKSLTEVRRILTAARGDDLR